MSVINTNIKSLVAQNSMKVNERSMSNSMQQLSTGSRINSAGDDAAGLSISSRMTSQIRGLDQAVRNGNDGISLLQTAEGAMVEMTNMMQRMRELAVQSASDSNTSSDRTNLNNEYSQLKTEITRIAANTEWNGMKILNGNNDFGTVSTDEQLVKFQLGSNADQTVNINFKDFTFTPNETPGSASSATLNLAGVTDADDADIFKATIGGVAIAIDTAKFADGAAVVAADANTLATKLQTEIRKYSGLEDVTVSTIADSKFLTFGSASGKTFASFSFVKQDGTTAATAMNSGSIVAYSAGSGGGGARPTGGVFTGAAQIDSTSISTAAFSNLSITALDAAINSVNSERSKIGATINRLTYAVDNLSNVSQNTAASRSRILDTDYAKASTDLARTQIIQQAATAMLAQANQSSQSVLALLK
jgi:flagellin